MRTLLEEFNQPLDKIERKWIRRPVLIPLIFVLILVCIAYTLFYACSDLIKSAYINSNESYVCIKEFIEDCW